METGDNIDGWTLGRKLGKGGFGTVFAARRDGKRAALKVFPNTEGANGASMRGEIIALQLMHGNRHAPRLIDTGDNWIAMGLITGNCLKGRLETDGPLDVEQASAIVSDVGRALLKARKLGITHGDIKPSNIMLRARSGRAVLIDWGLASPSGNIPLSIGTPGFVTPEVLDSTPIDERADVYGLGCLVHALLTGRSPFHREYPTETLRRQQEGRMSLRVSGALADVIRKACALSPDDRHQTIGAALDAFKAALAGHKNSDTTRQTN